jgi:hypothetical protein
MNATLVSMKLSFTLGRRASQKIVSDQHKTPLHERLL